MNITPKTKSNELLEKYPFLEKFFSNYGPSASVLRSKTARKAVGAKATLRRLAAVGGVDLDTFLADISKEVRGATGDKARITGFGRSHFKESAVRMRALEDAFLSLKAGENVEEAKASILDLIEDVELHELAAVEHTLVQSGISASDFQKLCDVHIGPIRQLVERPFTVEVLPGHPINTYIAANEKIESLANLFARLAEDLKQLEDAKDQAQCLAEMKKTLDGLKGVETHYIRKENLLFPAFEQHGLSGPPHVTWELHDKVRGQILAAEQAVSKNDVEFLPKLGKKLRDAIVDIVEKENRIVFPLALNTLTSKDWANVKSLDDQLGYRFVSPGTDWTPTTSSPKAPSDQTDASPEIFKDSLIPILSGNINPVQLDLVLNHLPVDFTFVDEYDEVRYFNSPANRIFARGEQAIGRKVQICHPVRSVHMVNRILSNFRKGTKDKAEFWFEMKKRFIHVRYIAVRDAEGVYRGCLETAQDITRVKQLEGKKRLLDWKEK